VPNHDKNRIVFKVDFPSREDGGQGGREASYELRMVLQERHCLSKAVNRSGSAPDKKTQNSRVAPLEEKRQKKKEKEKGVMQSMKGAGTTRY